MSERKTLPEELEALIKDGTLRAVGDGDYAIDALTHREREGTGWGTVTYTLEVGEDDDGRPLYEIREETGESGGDVLVSTNDADDAASWISGMIEEMEE
jgi:hypothetical protein